MPFRKFSKKQVLAAIVATPLVAGILYATFSNKQVSTIGSDLKSTALEMAIAELISSSKDRQVKYKSLQCKELDRIDEKKGSTKIQSCVLDYPTIETAGGRIAFSSIYFEFDNPTTSLPPQSIGLNEFASLNPYFKFNNMAMYANNDLLQPYSIESFKLSGMSFSLKNNAQLADFALFLGNKDSGVTLKTSVDSPSILSFADYLMGEKQTTSDSEETNGNLLVMAKFRSANVELCLKSPSLFIASDFVSTLHKVNSKAKDKTEKVVVLTTYLTDRGFTEEEAKDLLSEININDSVGMSDESLVKINQVFEKRLSKISNLLVDSINENKYLFNQVPNEEHLEKFVQTTGSSNSENPYCLAANVSDLGASLAGNGNVDPSTLHTVQDMITAKVVKMYSKMNGLGLEEGDSFMDLSILAYPAKEIVSTGGEK